MPDADKSSPRPWRPHPKYTACLVGPGGEMLVDCSSTAANAERDAANAAVVLRAVNRDAASDALVAALRLCRAAPYLGPDRGDMTRDVIDAALKLAEAP